MKSNRGNEILLDEDAEYMFAPWTITEHVQDGKIKLTCGKQHIWRTIMAAMPGEQVDHINHDHYDNRRCNLRICNQSDNKSNNTLYKNNKLGVKGVTKQKNRYHARVSKHGKTYRLGSFKTIEEAIEARTLGARRMFGKFCNE